ncbi:MAG: hypothetical protein KF696_13115 [Planctomycetes bacterium]|nr:hypothetical protein [Planctomycetota bacterium]MCW8135497.1 hypothetical protein [Planctomycetota bacterium]
MKRHPTVLAAQFAALCAACVLGCVKAANQQPPVGPAVSAAATQEQAPEPAKPAPPQTRPDKPWEQWVEQSMMRSKMRQLWYDCGIIVGNSMYPEIAEMFYLELAAGDVARKARGFAEHWENVRNRNREAATAASNADWRLARQKVNETNMACEACHFEHWSLATHGVLPETLKGWHDNDSVFGDEPWGQMKLNGAPAWVMKMYEMRAAWFSAGRGVRRLEKDRVLEATRKINDFADDQAKRWRSIETQANIIFELARKREPQKVEPHYLTIRNQCIDCHKLYAPDRGLDPMPWK